MPRMTKPRRSKRATISPTRPRSTASGLTRKRVRSMSAKSGFGDGALAAAPRPLRLRGQRGRHRLAVRAQAPGRVERRLAAPAGLLELRAAVRAGEEAGLGGVAAVRAYRVGTEPPLH